jgi:4-amino-4-deoxy-L-arabinose transferase-like glycosyltransferase
MAVPRSKRPRLANPTPRQYSGQARFLRGALGVQFLLGAVFLIKLAIVFQLKDHPILHPDSGLDTTAYANLARRVLSGDLWLGPGLYYVSPFYIYFLAGALTLFDSFTAVRIVQAALGTVAVGCIFLMTRAWFGTRAAWTAAVLAAGTGLFTFYESLILQSSIDAFFAAAALCALTYALQGWQGDSRTAPTTDMNGRSSRSSAFALALFVLAGVIFGLATLNRPNMLFGAIAVLGASLVGRAWKPALLIAAGILLGLAPSIVRNAVVSGQWSLVSSHGGLNLYIGNNEHATGFYREVPGIRPLIEGQEEDAIKVAANALGHPVSDAGASDYFRDLALTWMREHPVDAALLFGKKIFYTFQAQHVALPHSYPFFAYDMDTGLQFLVVGPWLLVPLGLTGLVFAVIGRAAGLSGRPRDFFVWLAFVPGYAFGVALFFVAERYRLPLLVPLCVGAGAAADMAWRAFRTRRLTTLAWPAVLVAGIAIVVNWPLPLNDGRWDDGLRTAQRLVILRDYAAADAWVERLERTTSRPGRAHHGVGMQLVAEDQPERALKHLTRSLELGYAERDDPEIWLRLGRLSARSQGSAAADPFFRRAVQLAPDRASARQQHGLNLLLLGRVADAKQELAEAVRLDPKDPDSLAHLAYCEVKLGEIEEARAHVRATLQHAPDHQLARQLAAALGIG